MGTATEGKKTGALGKQTQYSQGARDDVWGCLAAQMFLRLWAMVRSFFPVVHIVSFYSLVSHWESPNTKEIFLKKHIFLCSELCDAEAGEPPDEDLPVNRVPVLGLPHLEARPHRVRGVPRRSRPYHCASQVAGWVKIEKKSNFFRFFKGNLCVSSAAGKKPKSYNTTYLISPMCCDLFCKRIIFIVYVP